MDYNHNTCRTYHHYTEDKIGTARGNAIITEKQSQLKREDNEKNSHRKNTYDADIQ